jgi:hypothetical protein
VGGQHVTPPGWYPDPGDASALRYWDGRAWTEHVRAAISSPPPLPNAPARPASVPSSIEVPSVELERIRAELAAARAQLVEANDLMLLQEVGIYEYSHPLADSVQYRDRLDELKEQIAAAIKADRAISATNKWAVNGSAKDGAKMVGDFKKLMLRTYNNEVENVVRGLKPYALDSAIGRVDKVRATIKKLGAIMKVEVTDDYHRLRVTELELTADYAEKLDEERERQREERARLKEEEAAQREMQREQEKLEKEKAHYEEVLQALQEKKGVTPQQLARAEAKLEEVQQAIDGVVARAANTRAGYVYVISNHGAFGERVVKIGLTRRLDPLDRVRELGGASVPFRFDVHAIVFSDDAVGLETALHARFAASRVNLVNPHREFFYVRPQDVRRVLRELKGDLLSFNAESDAVEWRQSENIRRASTADAASDRGPVELPKVP